MTPCRRSVLTGLAALGAAAFAGRAGGAAPALVAAPGRVRLAPPGHPETRLWTYNGRAPGPVIRARRGSRVVRRLVNELPQDTTIHWHGIRIDSGMDGVPGLSQNPVGPGEEFRYDFAVNDAGTYWYHPHVRSWEQVARGLHGALIVEEHRPPAVDRDEVLVLDDWRLDAGAQIDESFGSMHDWSHAGRIGNVVTVNGDPDHRIAAGLRERLRLRLINASNARIFTLGLKGLEGWLVALDGQPLDAPERVERFRLAPAQRADLIVDVAEDRGGEAFLISLERDGGYALTTVAVDAPKRRVPPPPPAALQPNDVPPLGPLDGVAPARLTMAGGAMGGMRSALLGGVETEIRDLARQGRAWALNGVAEPPPDPFLRLARGRTARILMENETRWPHAMHLHGHHFRTIDGSGRAGPLRDTLLLDPGEKAEIAFVADNPGAWLFHCHMLEHAAAGMSTWIEVS